MLAMFCGTGQTPHILGTNFVTVSGCSPTANFSNPLNSVTQNLGYLAALSVGKFKVPSVGVIRFFTFNFPSTTSVSNSSFPSPSILVTGFISTTI
ncbi:MAG: hypothetical protein Q7I96_06545 [Methanobacteriaceae archaeon]|nr:hypothetical protein [Methanobacteriaceae archaeon]